MGEGGGGSCLEALALGAGLLELLAPPEIREAEGAAAVHLPHLRPANQGGRTQPPPPLPHTPYTLGRGKYTSRVGDVLLT